MSRAGGVAAKAARLRERQIQAAAAQTTTPPPTSVATEVGGSVGTENAPVDEWPVRSKPVRITVDLPPDDHAALGQWRLDTNSRPGMARVSAQDLVRGLLREAYGDPDLRQRVVEALRRD